MPEEIQAEGAAPLRAAKYTEEVTFDRFGRVVKKRPEGLPRAVEISTTGKAEIIDCSTTGGAGFSHGKLFELSIPQNAIQRFVWMATAELLAAGVNDWLVDAELRFTLNGAPMGALPLVAFNPSTTPINGESIILKPGSIGDIGGGLQPSATLGLWTGSQWQDLRAFCISTKVVADKAELWINKSTGDVNSMLALGVYIQSEFEGG